MYRKYLNTNSIFDFIVQQRLN